VPALVHQRGKSSGQHGCFGRIAPDEVQPTVVGRAEPHNLKLVHCQQDRVVTIHENARCQASDGLHCP
jgi:site-specific DNA-cytosine methylase